METFQESIGFLLGCACQDSAPNLTDFTQRERLARVQPTLESRTSRLLEIRILIVQLSQIGLDTITIPLLNLPIEEPLKPLGNTPEKARGFGSLRLDAAIRGRFDLEGGREG
jgi:hypothetical protein